MTTLNNETKQAFTYLGDAEYFGKFHLCEKDDAQCEGPVEKVIGYLENCLFSERLHMEALEAHAKKMEEAASDDDERSIQKAAEARTEADGCEWEDRGGKRFFSGPFAVARIEKEIAALREGSHFSFDA